MTRAERRWRRSRAIARRERIRRGWYGASSSFEYKPQGGRLAKFNLVCGCSACKRARYMRKAPALADLDTVDVSLWPDLYAA